MRLLKVRQPTKKVDGRIMFPTTHDLHIEHVDWWFPFLKEMLENGNDVLIVSKPEYLAVEAICCKLHKYRKQIEFRFTIGTNDEDTRKFWEPGAPSIGERLIALYYAKSVGYKTSVSMEPLLMLDPAPFIKTFDENVTGTIWIGLMNYLREKDFAPNEMEWYLRQLKINSICNMQKVYDSLKDNPKIRWKDSVRDLLGIEQNDGV